MDEVLLQPQLRERMEAASEGLRRLRLQLRGVQAERYKFFGGNANIANMLYGFSPSTLISTSDNWLTGTPPILRNSMNRPRRKTIEAAKAKIAAEFNYAKGWVGPTSVSLFDWFSASECSFFSTNLFDCLSPTASHPIFKAVLC